MKKVRPPVIGYCKLCRKENLELHKNSHIFPAFMIRNIKPKTVNQINDPLFVGVDSNNDLTKLQVYNYSGEFEQYILCKQCEKKLALLDDWGAVFLTHKTKGVQLKFLKKGFRESYGNFVGLNYKKYKLFILSLFARASICQRPGLNFKLDKLFEERISDMIVSDDAGEPSEFPISKFLLNKPPGINRDRLYYPLTVKPNIHTFFISDKLNNGIVYVLHTNPDELQYFSKENLLQRDGSMNAMLVDDFATGQFYLSFLKTETDRKSVV